MNRLCKQYISQVKLLLPTIGKSEKNYLVTLTSNLEDFCEDTSPQTMDDLYKAFGSPVDTVNSYIYLNIFYSRFNEPHSNTQIYAMRNLFFSSFSFLYFYYFRNFCIPYLSHIKRTGSCFCRAGHNRRPY